MASEEIISGMKAKMDKTIDLVKRILVPFVPVVQTPLLWKIFGWIITEL